MSNLYGEYGRESVGNNESWYGEYGPESYDDRDLFEY